MVCLALELVGPWVVLGFSVGLEVFDELHTYTETKHLPRANKFQSKTYHTNSPATQEHRPELQYTGCPKLLQNH